MGDSYRKPGKPHTRFACQPSIILFIYPLRNYVTIPENLVMYPIDPVIGHGLLSTK